MALLITLAVSACRRHVSWRGNLRVRDHGDCCWLWTPTVVPLPAMAQSKYTGRPSPLLLKSGLVAAFLAGTGVGLAAQNAHADGIVRCWGYNYYGECDVPADLGKCSRVAGGGNHTIALRSDGNVRCWGRNAYGESNTPSDLGTCSSIAGGFYHSIALRIDGTVRCWGAGTTNNTSDANFGQSIVPPDLGPCSSIAGGIYHSIAIRIDGSVRCWGRNDEGQCNTPVDLGTCSSVAGGDRHTIAVRSNGIVRCWGGNYFGQCNVPPDLGPCSSVAGGFHHSIALRTDGIVRCWGWNYIGQCNTPANVAKCSSVAGGGMHTIALQSDGNVRCWGDNNYGQCFTPSDLGISSSVAAGAFHTVAITNPDCNNNGINDSTELSGNDCDVNGIHDSCQIASQTLEDCNSNGLADQCEKEVQISIDSERFATVGYGYNKVWAVSNAVRTESTVTLTIRGHGDFSAEAEFIRVRGGVSYTAQALGGTFDCGTGLPSTTILTLSPQEFNTSIGNDGVLRLFMEASIAVNPNLCADGTWIEASLDYIGARPADCNANGLLDSCEIAAGYSPDSNQNGVIDTCESLLLDCPTDFNQSGSTDGADLGILLAAWGAAGQPGVDLNHDGIINGADLGALLADWGVCAN